MGGAAVVKTALLESGARSKREAPTETLEKIDEYFKTIGAMDVDDCGKLLVCTIETVSAEERTPVDTPDAPWTAKPSHKLWLKWPEFSNKTGLLLVNNFLVKGSNILI